MSDDAEATDEGSAPLIGRTLARLAAVQALYQLENSGAGVETVILEFRTHRLGADIEGSPIHEADPDYFAAIVRGVVGAQRRIDPYLEARMAKGWRLERINATSRAILRAALFELSDHPNVPAAVVIDEYLEVAHAFLDADDVRFINAVLDAASRDARGTAPARAL